MRPISPEIERFLAKVEQTDSCWNWVGSKYRFGYGHFRRKIHNKWVMYKAHRYSFEYFKGPIPAGSFVCHTCDNPSCVNPEHLFTGTAKDNVEDMFRKERRSRVIRNPKHRLLSFDVAQEIRSTKATAPELSGKDLAVMFSTSPTQISRILNNKIWQEVL